MSTKASLAVFCCIILTLQFVYSSISTAKTEPQKLMTKLQQQIKAKEEEVKKAEQINRSFERMIQLVNILGQVDNFLSERTKTVIKKLALLVEDEDGLRKQFRRSGSEEDD